VGPVRAAIARSLARRGDPRAVGALVAALGRADTEGSEAVADALAAFATGDAIEALVAAIDDAHLRRPATEALIRVGSRVVPYLVDRLRDAEAPLPLIDVLGQIRSTVATAALLEE